MSEFNAFLEEWKEIKTTQKALLSAYETDKKDREAKETSLWVKWLYGVLMVFLLLLGAYTGAWIKEKKSIKDSINTQISCFAAKGQWGENKFNNKHSCMIIVD